MASNEVVSLEKHFPTRPSSTNADLAVVENLEEDTRRQTHVDGIEESMDDIPDGAHGWVIISACAILAWWFVGINYTWGILQARFVEEGLARASTLSFLLRVIGTQKAATLGVSLIGVGEISASFATKSVPALFMCIGCITGIGASVCFMTVSIMPAHYFNRRSGLANGIVFAGGGLGGAAISLITERLITLLDVPWTLRIIGISVLVTGLPAAYFVKERIPFTPQRILDWSLFTSLRFDCLFIAGSLATFPLFVTPFFLPQYCSSLGLSSSLGAALVAAFNFSSAISRIALGLLCDHVGPVNVLTTTLLLNGISMLVLWPFSTSIAPLVVFAVWNGAANGGFFALIPTVVRGVFGSRKVPTAMSMVVTGWIGGYLLGGPIAGYMLDAYEGRGSSTAAYRPAMYYAGAMFLAASALILGMRLRISRDVKYIV